MIIGPKSFAVHNPETCQQDDCNICTRNDSTRDEGVHDLAAQVKFHKAAILSSSDNDAPPPPSSMKPKKAPAVFEDILDTTAKKSILVNSTKRYREEEEASSSTTTNSPRIIPHHKQCIQLCDGRIDDIGVSVLPSTQLDDQPRLLVHGIVTQRITGYEAFKHRRRKFKHVSIDPILGPSPSAKAVRSYLTHLRFPSSFDTLRL
ncbi:hypothetical protein Ciccas_003686 [Cichlidogyrus casuarinus]|uniref:Uncharacterized protein n=1 Tax=Cichlidogyrus casuarinus TaxID=1844966 RepID=A0ABD2QDM3_9PLAT